MLFKKIYFFNIVLFKIARSTQEMHILRGKLNQNVTFCVQHFFQNLLYKIIFFFKFVSFRKIFFFKIMLSKKIYFLEKLTRREIFNSKSDEL